MGDHLGDESAITINDEIRVDLSRALSEGIITIARPRHCRRVDPCLVREIG